MEFEMEFPLDNDGFLRRECPHCEQEFKWHHGKTDNAPIDFVYPDVYWCPRCGGSAAHDAWWTPEQLDYQERFVAARAPVIVEDALRDAFRGTSGRGITFTPARPSGSGTPVPEPLSEPDDMDLVAPPCHPWEPVKVPSDATAPFYCLVCGSAYSV